MNNVLRDEWGFRGMVLTDWNGSYGYQNTDDCVCNGNDAMLGFAKIRRLHMIESVKTSWQHFADAHPGASKWIREGGLFVVVSNLITVLKYLLLLFLPLAFAGLPYLCAYMIAMVIGECINFPIQRNFVFRSKGKVWYQAFWYLPGRRSEIK